MRLPMLPEVLFDEFPIDEVSLRTLFIQFRIKVNKELNINSIWNTFSDCEILHFYAAEISTDGLFQIQGKSDVLRHRNYTVGDGHSQGIQRSTNEMYSTVLTWF